MMYSNVDYCKLCYEKEKRAECYANRYDYMRNNLIDILYYKSSMGDLLLGEYEGKLCLCDWLKRRDRQAVDQRISRMLQADFVEKRTPLLEHAIAQLEAYFAGDREVFDLPLLTVGTPFQKMVWEAVSKITYASVVSYKNLAEMVGRAKAVRAVASAVGANALSIVIPCHRVLRSDGTLGGYAGGLAAKQRLLEMEKFHVA